MKASNIGLWVATAALGWVAWMLMDVSAPQKSGGDSSATLAAAQASGTPVLVEFYADWCGACKMIAPEVEELSTELAGKARVLRLNVETQPDVAAQYRVHVLPTFIAFEKGNVIARQTGTIPKAAMQKMLGF